MDGELRMTEIEPGATYAVQNWPEIRMAVLAIEHAQLPRPACHSNQNCERPMNPGGCACYLGGRPAAPPPQMVARIAHYGPNQILGGWGWRRLNWTLADLERQVQEGRLIPQPLDPKHETALTAYLAPLATA
jgi:hypothetical protein